MPRLSPILAALTLVACRPAQTVQTCPPPEAATPGAMLVTQVLLRRGPDLAPSVPDFTLSLTANGDALYSGSTTVPVPGQYMGRLSPAGFQRVVTDLFARGLALDVESGAPRPGSEGCHPQPVITLAVQTADGQYSRTTFCGRSEAESRLAGPAYSAIEHARWYPGARALTVNPAD